MITEANDNLARTKSGYKIKFHEELVKVYLQIRVVEMDIYVAPTFINLENPTFWISNLGYANVVGVCVSQTEGTSAPPRNSPRDYTQQRHR